MKTCFANILQVSNGSLVMYFHESSSYLRHFQAKLLHNLTKIVARKRKQFKTLGSRRSLAPSRAETVVASQYSAAARLDA